eukprot:gnl/MRDRNA2_/MRDRNA2_165747_c0_seq1.p1 gnl/MRDRNA2_/MRDRNA2_165747_c0~~gnl/MRDRNA2_/MRDRNA2_165747_c0_seq1.p1  ORF type:complete len:564 (-),score=95.83 gnl/MRDRNA2_/MRDRNA2_165747_c0_seq1:41-1651(-)
MPRKLKRIGSLVDPGEAEADGELENFNNAERTEELKRQLSTPTHANKRRLQKRASVISAWMAMPSAEPDWQKEFGKGFRPSHMLPLLHFKHSLDIAKVRQVLKERLCVFDRFRSKITRLPGKNPIECMSFEQVDLKFIDMEYHVTAAPEKSSPYTQADIDEFLASIYVQDFDVARPLWRFWVLNSLATGWSLLVGAVDHSICDGHTMVEVLFSILDEPPSTTVRTAPPRKPPPVPFLTKLSAVCYGYAAPILDPLFTDKPCSVRIKDVMNPTFGRSLAQAEKLDLDKVKKVKDCFPGATVNDILVGLMTLVFKRVLEEKGDPLLAKGKVRISAFFPINLRPDKDLEEDSFGNKIAVGKFPFNFDFKDRCECIWKVRYMSEWVKWNPAPYVNLKLQNRVFRRLNAEKFFRMMRKIAPQFPTTLITNVPGPQVKVKFCGQEVEDLYFHVWLNYYASMWAIFSYAGQIQLAVNTDPAVMLAEDITKHWKPEFDKLFEETIKHGGPVPMPPRPVPQRLLVVIAVLVALASRLIYWMIGMG